MIKEIEILNFRNFEKGLKISLSKNMTVISGKNGTSKTTLLGMIAKPFKGNEKDIYNNDMSGTFSEIFKINPDKIAGLIGPGGKNIRAIIDETGVSIDIEDDGKVSIFGNDAEKMARALELVKLQTQSVELNAIYEGKVTKIMKFGAFVEVLPGKEGLLHISEISDKRIAKTEDVLKEGDIVRVKVISIENEDKFNLSIKALNNK